MTDGNGTAVGIDGVDLGKPLFTYGLLKPGELAHDATLGGLVLRDQSGHMVDACLRYRDGLPLLEEARGRIVHGVLLWFREPEVAYKRVGKFEPRNLYLWSERAATTATGETVCANVLIGRSPDQGSSEDRFDMWTAARDPAFAFGPLTIARLVDELASEEFPVRHEDHPEPWDRFFRMQAAYLALWSLVERYTALSIGPNVGPAARVTRLGADSSFRAAVRQAGVVPSRIIDSRDPGVHYQIRGDGSGAAQYWYGIRSNLSHRGKSAFQDGQLLRRALIDLHNTFRLLLLDRLPDVEDAWQRVRP